MPRYLDIAADANKTAKQLYDLTTTNNEDQWTKEYHGEVACLIAKLVNYGLRCAPRAVQSTVRLRAVQRATQSLPVKVSMQEVTDERTGKTFNALTTTPVTPAS